MNQDKAMTWLLYPLCHFHSHRCCFDLHLYLYLDVFHFSVAKRFNRQTSLDLAFEYQVAAFWESLHLNICFSYSMTILYISQIPWGYSINIITVQSHVRLFRSLLCGCLCNTVITLCSPYCNEANTYLLTTFKRNFPLPGNIYNLLQIHLLCHILITKLLPHMWSPFVTLFTPAYPCCRDVISHKLDPLPHR